MSVCKVCGATPGFEECSAVTHAKMSERVRIIKMIQERATEISTKGWAVAAYELDMLVADIKQEPL